MDSEQVALDVAAAEGFTYAVQDGVACVVVNIRSSMSEDTCVVVDMGLGSLAFRHGSCRCLL